MSVPDCVAAPAVAPDCLDSLTGHPSDYLAMSVPDCLAAAAARLDGNNDDRALDRRQRGHVCEMDTDHMG
jgi:hypothetical protein